ncbi:DUF3987 domain-containing protein [Mesorhizobium sp. LjNodule214]|uniref:DUF3987 domain-containing protein n=1 Tax=Mesorhizobium sp. LjNodule214 TaxID=3342252 RepID=UPI003ECE8548
MSSTRNNSAAQPCPYSVGDRVEHPKLGHGTVVKVVSPGGQVKFDRGGPDPVGFAFMDYLSPSDVLVPPPPHAANDNNSPVDLWARYAHPPLPSGLLPSVIEEYARVQAEMMGVDAGGLAAAALAVCAAAIPDSIQLKVKRHDDWMESPRIWVALIGSPSTKKSPLIANATAPLKKIDRELYRAYVEAKAEYDALDKEAKKTATAPKHVRLRLEDTTIEAAQEVLKDSPNGVLCLQDELSGWFGSMDKYSGNRGAAKDRAFWLQSFNGGNYTVNRIARGAVWIDNLSVSMLGGIQPEPMRKVAGDAVDDGLLQRLFPIVLGNASIGKDEPTPPVVEKYAALVERLHGLSKPLASSSMVEVPLRFDKGAQVVRNDLEAKHHAMAACWEAVNKKLAAHIGKYDGLFARLCAIWHCIESTGSRPASEVKEDTARRVAAFLHDFLFPHAIAFYADVLGLSERHDALLATAGWILAHQPSAVTVRSVRRGDSVMRAMDNHEAQSVLERLDAFGWLEPVPTARRDSLQWTVRPAVHTLFAARATEEAERRRKVREVIADAGRLKQAA